MSIEPTFATRLLTLGTLMTVCACGDEAPDPNDPDILLVNGSFATMVDDAIVEAVSIRGNRIVATGSSSKIRQFAGPNTEIIDLGGRTATPGLIDVHNHFAWGAADFRYTLNLAYPGITRIGDILAMIRDAAEERGAGEWIIGTEWDAGKMTERRDITLSDLDIVSPNNPVWLLHTSAHYGVANSRALGLAGISRDTPDPEGGVIVRDGEGRPNGLLRDRAMALIEAVVPPYKMDQFAQAVTELVHRLNAEGITTIKDPEIDQRHWDAYRQVQSRGDLTVRVFALWRAPDSIEEAKALLARIAPLTDPEDPTGDERLISGGVKIYVDGSGTARTAWVYDQWNMDFSDSDEGNFGLTYLPPDILLELIQLFHKAGIHMGIHAIGDRAIDFTVEAYDRVLAEDPLYGLRHSIIHCNIPTDHAMDVMYRLQSSYDAAYPEVQPAFLWWIGDAYAGNFGPERNPRLLPLKTFLARGIKWASSSDYNVSPFAPRYGLWAAVARQTLLGTYGRQPYGTEESIPVEEALRSYTTRAARQVFLEDKIGSIEAGKLADIVVWDRDPLSVPTGEIKEMRALMTIFDGEVVHRDADAPISSLP